jgi:hypothetical protein
MPIRQRRQVEEVLARERNLLRTLLDTLPSRLREGHGGPLPAHQRDEPPPPPGSAGAGEAVGERVRPSATN